MTRPTKAEETMMSVAFAIVLMEWMCNDPQGLKEYIEANTVGLNPLLLKED